MPNTAYRPDPEFAALFPPHTPAELAALAADIRRHGVRTPVLVWDGLLLDGHARHEVATSLGLPVPVERIDLPDRAAAREWRIRHVLGRRNLRPIAAKYFRGALASDGGRQGARSDRDPAAAKATLRKRAEELGVSVRTLRRDVTLYRVVELIATVGELGVECRSRILSGVTRLRGSDLNRLGRMRASDLIRYFAELERERVQGAKDRQNPRAPVVAPSPVGANGAVCPTASAAAERNEPLTDDPKAARPSSRAARTAAPNPSDPLPVAPTAARHNSAGPDRVVLDRLIDVWSSADDPTRRAFQTWAAAHP